jgi:hypothetical protein
MLTNPTAGTVHGVRVGRCLRLARPLDTVGCRGGGQSREGRRDSGAARAGLIKALVTDEVTDVA